MKRPERSRGPRPESELQGALHEVSNALTVVLGWLDDARTSLPAGSAREAMVVAYTHARRGHTVARRAIGATVEEPAAGDSQDVRRALGVASDAIVATAKEAAANGVCARLSAGASDAVIEGADDALQILINLILNAVSFSPAESEVQVDIQLDGNDVLFCVADEGPGVPESSRDTLFTSGHSLRPGGAGVGLSHCHALAEERGAELRLLPSESGAHFELRWPQSEAPSQIRQLPPTRQGMQGLRVLLLEDDAAVMTMVQFGLESRGAVVSPARSAADLERLAEGTDEFDAALIDFSPIQHDAKGALEKLQAKKGPLPVILISGSAIAPDKELQLHSWVQKPFELGELYEAILQLRASGQQR